MDGIKGYISVNEAAGILGVSPQWIRKLLQDGGLKGTKSGRDWLVLKTSVIIRQKGETGADLRRRKGRNTV